MIQSSVPYKVLLHPRLRRGNVNDPEYRNAVKKYVMNGRPEYVVKGVQGDFVICERREGFERKKTNA